MATSVVENNSLKDFDAYVAFGKSIFTGAGKKVWEDLKDTIGAFASPKETYNTLKKLVTSPEAIEQLGKDTYKEVKDKLDYIGEILFSDTEYGNKEATLAGEKTGEILLLIGESVGGIKGLTTVGRVGVKGVSDIAKNTVKSIDGKIDDALDIDFSRPSGTLDVDPKSQTQKPYAKHRPPHKQKTVDEVWEKAKDRNGKVYDPHTKEEITWDKSKPRNGQWDMGHKKETYKKLHDRYMNNKITKEEFLKEHHNPKNYHPQTINSNRSRRYDK